MPQPRVIRDFSLGDVISIYRRFQGDYQSNTATAAKLTIYNINDRSNPLLVSNINNTVAANGVIVDDGGNSPFVIQLKFILDAAATNQLVAHKLLQYDIVVTCTNGDVTLEVGNVYALPAFSNLFSTAKVTNASSSIYSSARVAALIDGMLDSLLGDFRQLKVWDEHARRIGTDPANLKLTYENLNPAVDVEVFDGGNNTIPEQRIHMDFQNGMFYIENDDGTQDYFVTYSFNMFPETDLIQFLNLALGQVNASAEPGTFLTTYSQIEETPGYWDAALATGAAALAFKRLVTNGLLWRNYLIFQNGDTALQYANEAASYYSTMFDSMRLSLKRGQFIAKPTVYYDMFRNSGFGFLNPNSEKFRGLRINRISNY